MKENGHFARDHNVAKKSPQHDGHVFPCHIDSTYTLADNKIFKVGIYEIDDDWKPFLTHNYDNDMESYDEDDKDAISDTMIVEEENKSDDMSDTLEEGEIESDFESE
ncbi:unnamed protein product [Lactuca saligna]|uniref:Uncharacterized protein n=1 Tax=Lactuca saligna TaxID=75948 RepID=A0AA35ZET5_LACSI|nr:unnamed protein product [Lactuca saligna]